MNILISQDKKLDIPQLLTIPSMPWEKYHSTKMLSISIRGQIDSIPSLDSSRGTLHLGLKILYLKTIGSYGPPTLQSFQKDIKNMILLAVEN